MKLHWDETTQMENILIYRGEAMSKEQEQVNPHHHTMKTRIEAERDDLGDHETLSELLEELDKIDREEGPVGMPPYLKRILAAYRREQV